MNLESVMLEGLILLILLLTYFGFMRSYNVASKIFVQDCNAGSGTNPVKKRFDMEPLPRNWIKININASSIDSKRSAALGYVMKDNRTRIIRAKGCILVIVLFLWPNI